MKFKTLFMSNEEKHVIILISHSFLICPRQAKKDAVKQKVHLILRMMVKKGKIVVRIEYTPLQD